MRVFKGDFMAQDSRSWLTRLGDRVISESDTEKERLQKTLLIFACGLMGFGAMLWVAIYQAMGIRFSTTVPLTYLAVSASSLGLYIWQRNLALFRFIQVSLFLFVPFIMQWSIGSYVSSSGVMLWALLAPVGVMIFQGPRDSLPWFAAYIVMTAVSGFFDYFLTEGAESGVTMQSIAVFFTLNFAAVSTIVYLLISYFIRERDKLERTLDAQNRIIREEQEKSERLLLNVLPGPIARRLKEGDSTIADGLSDVTVMFADIIDFTRLSEEMPPKFVVTLLNEVFSHFDTLAEKYGLEKIKTIGDAYMVAGGIVEHNGILQQPDQDYSAAVCAMAIEMRDYMSTLSGIKQARLQLHTGIATGPVVAGVIGIKKFTYDLWGDTVNMASRVTAEAGPGVILVDATTYKRVRYIYDFEGPVELQLKGKGSFVAYRLVATRSATAQSKADA